MKVLFQITEAEFSHQQIADMLTRALQDEKSSTDDSYDASSPLSCYPREVYDDYFIYAEGPELYRRDYSIDDTGEVTLGDSVEVVEFHAFTPVDDGDENSGDEGDGEYIPEADDDDGPLVTLDELGASGADDETDDSEVDWENWEPTRDEVTRLAFGMEYDGEVVNEAKDPFHRGMPRGTKGSPHRGNIRSIINAFGRWAGGSHATCTAKLAGKGFSDVDALCAWLKDRYLGTTKWRGKHKKEAVGVSAPGALVEREVSQEKRMALAKVGKAMPDGSFPIETEADVREKVSQYGRSSNPEAAKRHIIKRARELGCLHALPEKWGVKEAITASKVTLVGGEWQYVAPRPVALVDGRWQYVDEEG